MKHFPPSYDTTKSKLIRRTLRQKAIPAEAIIWKFIRNRQLGYKFRRQFDIHSFVVDFYCHELRLVIELDGWTHDFEKTKQRDLIKERVLKQSGCKVIRMTNEEVYGDVEILLSRITAECKKRALELGVNECVK